MTPVEAATTLQPAPPVEGVSSFAKSLFLGEIHEELVFPYPRPDEGEQRRVRELIGWLREYAAEKIDPRAIEEQGWVGDELIRDLGERGFCGLYVPEEYGGQGLSQTGYCRVFETLAQTDASLSVVLGCTSRSATKASPYSAATSRRRGSCPAWPQVAGWRGSR